MKTFALLLTLRWIASASASISDSTQQPLILPPQGQNCVAQPPQGVCYSAQFCTGGKPGPEECDFYTVTHDNHGNQITQTCIKDPKRPRCGVQADGLTCDPDNGWGDCCSEDGYCGKGDYYCKIKKDPGCPNCPQNGGCQCGACEPRPDPTPDNTCGPLYGGKICDPAINAGPCCSKQGECGSSPAHCDWDQNCQSNCTTGGDSQLNRCGPEFGGKLCDDGQCCSAHGYCGSTASHCGDGCQSGACSSEPEENRCGSAFNNKPCPNSEDCCSQDGFCGQDALHCRVGCQSGACEAIGSPPPQCSSDRPNQIFACECQPGQSPTWQTIPNAPCDISSSSGKCNGPCPGVEGAVQDINGSNFTYRCQNAYSSRQRTNAPGQSLYDCGKMCSSTPNCVATNYFPDNKGAECALHFIVGDLQSPDPGVCGTLVRDAAAKPPPEPSAEDEEDEEDDGDERARRERHYRKMCPSGHDTIRNSGSKRYRIHCDSALKSPVSAAIIARTDTESACEVKCNEDSRCKGFEWEADTGNCWKTDGDLSVESRPGYVSFVTEQSDDTLAGLSNPNFKRLCPVQDGRTLRIGDTIYSIHCNQKAENRDQAPISTQASDQTTCLQRCTATDDCEMISWHPQTETCWMSRSQSALTPARGHVALRREGDWHYDACYTDQGKRGLPEKDWEATGGSLTIESCQDGCLFRKGKRMAGVENSNECFCGDDVVSKSRRVKEEECKKPCQGNRNQKCGGFWKMGVWVYAKRP